MGAAKKKRSGGIPLVAFFKTEDDRRLARMALEHPETLPPGAAVELERYLADPQQAVAEDMQQLLDKQAQSNQGRPRPETAAKVHIREKLAEHPELAPMALRESCDETIIGSMSKAAFRNTVAAIRRESISHR